MSGRRYHLALVYFGLVTAACWTGHELSKPVWASGAPEAIHRAVIAGEADYPHQFRPLVPWFCELLHRGGVPLELAYLFQRLACSYLAVLLLHVWLRRWLTEGLCLAGGAILAGLLPFSMIGTGFQPTDPLCLLLFVWACLLLHDRRDGLLVAVVAGGMFGRETLGLVALLAAVVRLDEWRTPGWWRLVGALTLVSLGVWGGLHLWYGPREAFTELVTPAVNLPANLTRPGSLRAVVLYGWLWWLAAGGLAGQPAFLRRAIILVPVFFIVYLSVGLIGETRYFLPLAPIVLPLALRRLYPEAAR